MSPKLNNRYVILSGLLVLFAGLVVLTGWIFQIPILTSLGMEGYMSMKANGALCFVICGLSLLLLNNNTGAARKTGQFLALLVMLIGLVTLLEYIFKSDAGIDQLIALDPANDRGRWPGRMNPAGAFNFIIAGLALFLSHSRKYQSLIRILLFVMGTVACLAFIGFNFRKDYTSNSPFLFTIPLHAAILFIILSTGIFLAPFIRGYRINLQWKLIAVLVFIVAIMLTSFYSLNSTNAEFVTNAESVSHTHEVLNETERILSSAKDLESGGRGFLLTQNSEFLEPMELARDSIQFDLQQLKSLTIDHDIQYRRVDSMSKIIAELINYHNTLVAWTKSGNRQQALEKIASKQGKNLMDNLRQIGNRIKEEENRLLDLRKKNTEASIGETIKTILFFQALILCLLITIYLIIYSNQNARDKAEADLKESEEWFATTLSSIGDGVIVTDTRKNVIFMNPVARQLTRWGMEAYGQPIDSIFHIVHEQSREIIDNPVSRVLAEKQIVGLSNHTVLIRKDQSEIAIDDSAAPIVNDDGEITGVVLVFRDVTEQKKKEDAIRYNAQMLSCISDAVMSTDDQFRIKTINKRAEELYGWKEEEIVGMQVPVLLDIEIPFEDRAEVGKALMQKGEWHGEVRAKDRQGNIKSLLVSAAMVKDENGKVLGSINIHRDITDRIRAEEKNRYNSILVENISDAILSTDTQFRVVTWNKAAEEMYGYTEAEILGKPVGEVLKLRDQEQSRADALNKLHEADYYRDEYEFTTKSGELITVLAAVNVIRNNKGEITGYVAVHRNITERKKAAERINYLAGLIEQTSDAIVSIDEQSRIISWNKGAEVMYGYSRQEVIGKHIQEFTQSTLEPELEQIVVKEIRQKGSWSGDRVHRDRKGNPLFVYVSLSPIKSETDAQQRFVLVISNITERIKLEEQLRTFNQQLGEQVQEKTSQIQDMLNRISDGFMALDTNWRFTYLNKAASQIYRMQTEKLIGKNVWEYFPEAIGNPFYEACHKALQTQQHTSVEAYSDIFDYWYETHIYPSPNGLSIYFRDVSEKKRAEQLVVTNEETRRLIFNTAMDAIICADHSGKITIWNPQAVKIFGWTEEEAIGRSLEDTIIPERYRERHKKGMAHYLSTGEGPALNRLIELFALKRTGEEFPVEITIVPIEQNGTGFFCSFIRDITERKRTQDAIIKERDFSEKLVDGLPGIFYFFDSKGKFIRWNKQLEIISGYTADEIGRMHPSEFFAPTEKETVSNQMKEVLKRGYSEQEGFLITKSGQKIPFYFTGTYLDFENQPCILGTGIDISERKKIERKLADERRLLRALIDNLPDYIYVKDQQFRHIINNRANVELLGAENESDTLGKTVFDYFDKQTAQPYHADDELVFRTGQAIVNREEAVNGPDGEQKWLLTTKVPLVDKNQKVNMIVGISRDITEWKKTQDAILKEKVFSEKIIDSLPGIFYFFDEKGKFIRWNKLFETISGYSHEEIRHMHPTDFFADNEKEYITDRIREVFEKGTSDAEAHFRTKDGKLIPYYFTGSYIEFAGKPCLLGTGIDITVRKKTEKELERSIERFEMISRTTNDAIWEWDMHSNQVWANARHHELYGFGDHDDLPDHNEWQNRLHPDERKSVVNDFQKTLKGNSNSWIAEYRFLNGQKEFINIYDRTYIVRDQQGQPIRTMGSMMDITARKLAEKNLKENEEKYRLLFSSSPLPMWVYDIATYRILDVNEAATQHYGYSREEFLGMTIEDIRPREDVRKMKDMSERNHPGVRSGGNWRHLKKDGSMIDVEIKSHDILYNNRTARLVLANDITEKLKAEKIILETSEQLRQLSARLQEIREEERMHMAHEIHDELGQRLTVLKMDVSWLKRNIGEKDPTAKEKIQGTLDLLDGTIKIVRKIATDLRPGILDDLGLIPALEWQSKEFENRSGIKVHFQSNISEIALPTHLATGLFRIYQEALTNVGRHSGAGHVYSNLEKGEGFATLTITDDGKGFDASSIGSRKTLGIMGMKERTMMLGGEYAISSSPGKGTTISVKVPLS